MTLFGIERNTDSLDPQSVVERFRTEAAARRWREGGKVDGKWPKAYADPSNNHHRVRELFETPAGSRITERRVREYLSLYRGSSHAPRTGADARASIIRSEGASLP
jgi:hypothetical protein